MRTVTLTAGAGPAETWDPILIRLAELHTMQSFAATRLELAAERARGLLGSAPVAVAAAIEIADLLRTAAGAAGRATVGAQELRRDIARIAAGLDNR